MNKSPLVRSRMDVLMEGFRKVYITLPFDVTEKRAGTGLKWVLS